MRFLAFPVVLTATPAIAAHPVPLAVPANAQVMFGANGPQSLADDHVLHSHVTVEPIVGAPEKIGKFLLPITNAKELNDGLTQSLAHSGMLSTGDAKPIFRLTATWQYFDAPAQISFSSHAKITIHYQLQRVDTGAVIFARSITTMSESRGGEAADRLKGVARLAILTNFASAVACIDKAAYGAAPADCALKPAMTYQARSPAIVTFVPRIR